MFIIAMKFLEVAFRAFFVVGATYLLPLAEAGQFGLIVTMQGLASFAFGYERHVDIQRRMIGGPEADFDGAVARALVLFAVNYGLLAPVYLLTLYLTLEIDGWLLLMCLAVAIAEQVMNQAYQISMVNRRYIPLLVVAVVKNATIFACVAGALALPGVDLSLHLVIAVWAGVSTVCTLTMIALWLRFRVAPGTPGEGMKSPGLWPVLRAQYAASRTHFFLGLTAIVMLQFDRLSIGAILPLETVGVYFRHVLLVSMVYQVFNIAFFNRVVPHVFRAARTEPLTTLRGIVSREYVRVLAFLAVATVFGLSVHAATGGAIAERYSLSPGYFIGLLCATAIRMRADFNGLVFNSLHLERVIFRLQLLSFSITAPLLIGLTMAFGILGTIAAGICGAALYFVFTTVALRRLPDERPA